jgi:glycerol-3-phosphate dehydrogenase
VYLPLRSDPFPFYYPEPCPSLPVFTGRNRRVRADEGVWQFEGRKLTEVINSDHENKKYLPGVQLPENVVAIPDIGGAIKDATALVFVMPHQCA